MGSRQDKAGRPTTRAPKRARGDLKIVPPTEQSLRTAAVRRALLADPDGHRTPLLVAAAAILHASGWGDFSEGQLRDEGRRIQTELRLAFGFTHEQEQQGAWTWAAIAGALRCRLPTSTWTLWIRPLRGLGLVNGRLLVGPGPTRLEGAIEHRADPAWVERRYARAIAALAPPGIEIAYSPDAGDA